MKCFEHSNVDSVGVCKSCGKGICRQCANDLGEGLACSGRCEAKVRALVSAEMNAINAYQSAKKGYLVKPFFTVAAGAMFMATGLLSGNSGLGFMVILGGLFVAFGVALWIQAARFARTLK